MRLKFRTKEETDRVIEAMKDIIINFDYVSVNDLYDLVGLPSKYNYTKTGWISLDGIEVKYENDLYVIVFPEITPIDSWAVPTGVRVNWIDGSQNIIETITEKEITAIQDENQELKDAIHRIGYRIIKGNFTLRSGEIHHVYLEKIDGDMPTGP